MMSTACLASTICWVLIRPLATSRAEGLSAYLLLRSTLLGELGQLLNQLSQLDLGVVDVGFPGLLCGVVG